jgi:hypothetical protein
MPPRIIAACPNDWIQTLEQVIAHHAHGERAEDENDREHDIEGEVPHEPYVRRQ